MFLQIILTYQMMSLTPGTESPENEDSLSYNSETNSEQKELWYAYMKVLLFTHKWIFFYWK